MTEYSFQYRLHAAPAARADGSGIAAHDVSALSQPVGNGGYSEVPARHKTFCIPAGDLQAVMDMADSTGPQKAAKNAAYKVLLVANVDTVPVPLGGWSSDDLQAVMDANDAASAVVTEANEYLTVTLGLSYPVDFNY